MQNCQVKGRYLCSLNEGEIFQYDQTSGLTDILFQLHVRRGVKSKLEAGKMKAALFTLTSSPCKLE